MYNMYTHPFYIHIAKSHCYWPVDLLWHPHVRLLASLAGSTESYPTTGKPEETWGLRVGDKAQHGGFHGLGDFQLIFVHPPKKWWIHMGLPKISKICVPQTVGFPIDNRKKLGWLCPPVVGNLHMPVVPVQVTVAIDRRKSWIYALPGLRHGQTCPKVLWLDLIMCATIISWIISYHIKSYHIKSYHIIHSTTWRYWHDITSHYIILHCITLYYIDPHICVRQLHYIYITGNHH